MAIVSLASCTKEELEPQLKLYQPYEDGYVVYLHQTTFTVAKIVVGDYNYYEAQTFEQDGWYIPSVDELAYEAKFTGLPEFFSVNGNADFYWSSNSAAWTGDNGIFHDWQMGVYFYNNIFHHADGDGKNSKRHIILFKKFAR